MFIGRNVDSTKKSTQGPMGLEPSVIMIVGGPVTGKTAAVMGCYESRVSPGGHGDVDVVSIPLIVPPASIKIRWHTLWTAWVKLASQGNSFLFNVSEC